MSGRGEFRVTVARALVVALFVAYMPVSAGVIVTRSEGLPTFTLDVCHPLPGLSRAPGFSAVPLTEGTPLRENCFWRSSADEPPVARVIRTSECPDPPPPKTLI